MFILPSKLSLFNYPLQLYADVLNMTIELCHKQQSVRNEDDDRELGVESLNARDKGDCHLLFKSYSSTHLYWSSLAKTWISRCCDIVEWWLDNVFTNHQPETTERNMIASIVCKLCGEDDDDDYNYNSVKMDSSLHLLLLLLYLVARRRQWRFNFRVSNLNISSLWHKKEKPKDHSNYRNPLFQFYDWSFNGFLDNN